MQKRQTDDVHEVLTQSEKVRKHRVCEADVLRCQSPTSELRVHRKTLYAPHQRIVNSTRQGDDMNKITSKESVAGEFLEEMSKTYVQAWLLTVRRAVPGGRSRTSCRRVSRLWTWVLLRKEVTSLERVPTVVKTTRLGMPARCELRADHGKGTVFIKETQSSSSWVLRMASLSSIFPIWVLGNTSISSIFQMFIQLGLRRCVYFVDFSRTECTDCNPPLRLAKGLHLPSTDYARTDENGSSNHRSESLCFCTTRDRKCI